MCSHTIQWGIVVTPGSGPLGLALLLHWPYSYTMPRGFALDFHIGLVGPEVVTPSSCPYLGLTDAYTWLRDVISIFSQ